MILESKVAGRSMDQAVTSCICAIARTIIERLSGFPLRKVIGRFRILR